MWNAILHPSADASGLTIILTVLSLLILLSLLWAAIRYLANRRAAITCFSVAAQALLWGGAVWYAIVKDNSLAAVLLVTGIYAIVTLIAAGVLYAAGYPHIGGRITYYSIIVTTAIIAAPATYALLLRVGGVLQFAALWTAVIGGATYMYDTSSRKQVAAVPAKKKARK